MILKAKEGAGDRHGGGGGGAQRERVGEAETGSVEWISKRCGITTCNYLFTQPFVETSWKAN